MHNMANEQIRDGMVVILAYTLTVEGELVEESTADDPLEYLHGAEDILPGLEAQLSGKKIGDHVSVTLQPEDAYGEYDEDDYEAIEPDDLPDDIEVGTEILLEDDEGYMFEAIVKEITHNAVILDFNPALAGKVVTYEVDILGMREATADEVAHGHVHDE